MLVSITPAHAQYRSIAKDFIVQVGVTDATATEKMRVTTGGLVGVGLTSPSYQVDVSGTVRAIRFIGDGSALTNLAANTPDRITSGTISVVANSTGYISLTTGGTTTGYFDTAGKLTVPGGYFTSSVGIGMAPTSTAILSIAAPSGNTYTQLSRASTSFEAGLRWVTGSTTDWFVGTSTAANVNALHFKSQVLGKDIMQLLNNGRVGIGYQDDAAIPQTALDVSGTIRVSTGNEACSASTLGALKYSSNDFYLCRTAAAGWEALDTIAASGFPDRIISGTTQAIAYKNASLSLVTAGTERVVIGSNGNVGIAQQPASATLSVSGTIQASMGLYSAASPYIYPSFWAWAGVNSGGLFMPYGYIGSNGSFRSSWMWNGFRNNSDTWTSLGVNGYSGAMGIEMGYDGIKFLATSTTPSGVTSPPARMMIDPSGNVGIGTTVPSTTLHVNGAGKSFVTLLMSNELSGTTSSIVQEKASISMRSYGTALAGGGGGIVAYAPNSDTFPNTVQLYTSGLVRMTATANGNVGIGTTNPAYLFDVSGTVRATAFLGDGSQLSGIAGDNLGNHTATTTIKAVNGTAALPAYTWAGDTNTGLYWAAADQIGLATGGAQRALLNASGLTVTGYVSTTGVIDAGGAIYGFAGDSVTAPGYTWSGDTNTGMYWVGADQLGLTAGGVQRVLVNTAGATVTGNLTATKFVGDGSSLTNLPDGDTIASNTTSIVAQKGGVISITTNGTTANYFDTAGRHITPGISITTLNGVSSTNGYFSGNVGIGIAADSAVPLKIKADPFKLSNMGTGTIGLGNISETYWNGNGLVFTNSTQASSVTYHAISQNAGNLFFGRMDTVSGTIDMVIESTGLVGVGVSDPLAPLHVYANGTTPPLRLQYGSYNYIVGPGSNGAFVVYNASNAGVYMTYGGTAWSANSDRRLKKDVAPLDASKGLEAIAQLQPVTYRWRTVGAPSTTQTGFIAQDVEKVFPALISHAPDTRIRNDDGSAVSVTDVKGLNYEGLIPPMVEAIKQLKAANDNLKAENDNLKARSASMENEIRQLRQDFEAYKKQQSHLILVN